MSKNYRSDALASVHEMMESLHDIGAVTKQTMREFDETCLQPAPVMSPERIRALREREHLSQPVFARYLNVSKKPDIRLGTWCKTAGRCRSSPSFSRREKRNPGNIMILQYNKTRRSGFSLEEPLVLLFYFKLDSFIQNNSCACFT